MPSAATKISFEGINVPFAGSKMAVAGMKVSVARIIVAAAETTGLEVPAQEWKFQLQGGCVSCWN